MSSQLRIRRKDPIPSLKQWSTTPLLCYFCSTVKRRHAINIAPFSMRSTRLNLYTDQYEKAFKVLLY
uniref:Uncharacterized protein n=1 Tax=Utricularia reniformis TaxID=192314 RepID=A0A1Y0B3U0_9LAMI|nr:hypothetical protein AEK19_MT0831 [Utricularia reniformis]YP_009382306.1 hypothetical protein AEK19_MT1878 [Utricularia reniformis]ART31064.1 hypothetical protein AEK19_MT0831 [Utricularia reniformis]ART32047.1 hypothetical protein AEK19_MT1878 [Utricularia reniformis]